MSRKPFYLLPLLALPLQAGAATPAQTLSEVASALGAESLQSIQFSGAGGDYALGQFGHAGEAWPKFIDKSYQRVVSFAPWATELQRTRLQGENPPRGGGGQPIFGEQQQTQSVTAESPTAISLQSELAVTLPQAFVKAAQQASDLKAEEQHAGGKHYTVLSFTAPNKARTRGWVNAQHQIERVETQIDNPVYGDVNYEVQFSGYRDFGGVQFPEHIVQKAGGYPVLELNVSEVKLNVPAQIKASVPPAPVLASEQLGKDVWLISGGYAAVAVGFKDHVLIIEGGQNDQRSEAVIAEAKRLFPGKKIGALVNTHAHFDHAGGLRNYVAEGATIITHESNVPYFQKVWANPHRLAPDRLALHPRPAKFRAVKDELLLSDGEHSVQLFRLQDFGHNDGTLVAYLPNEKVLVEADAFNPPASPLTQTPASISPFQQSLVANIEARKLLVERIVPIHLPADNRKIAYTELLTAVGRIDGKAQLSLTETK